MPESSRTSHIEICPCCGHDSFGLSKVLWSELIKEWHLSNTESAYINRQQGLYCQRCESNLRSMTLAKAIMRCFGYKGTFEQFVKRYKNLKVLEINEAGRLDRYLAQMPNHTLASYPEVDMMQLPYANGYFDLVVHSDTLEHVEAPITGLSEIFRVLKPNGFTCYTIPIIIDRLTSTRKNKSPSYHGTPGNDEHLVQTEYGSDMWTQLFHAGFTECRLLSIDYPASVAITAMKDGSSFTEKSLKASLQKISIRLKN